MLRRMLRLAYAPACNLTGMPSSVMVPVACPGLLSSFGKIRFHPYQCDNNIDATAGDDATTPQIFPSRHAFLCWEAAMELHWAFEQVSPHASQQVMKAGTSHPEKVNLGWLRQALGVFGTIEGAGWEWVGKTEEDDISMDLVKAASLCLKAYMASETFPQMVESVSSSKPKVDLLTSIEQAYDKAYPGKALPQSLAEALASDGEPMVSTPPESSNRYYDDDIDEEDEADVRKVGAVVSAPTPEYLLPFDAGWVLCEVIWEGVDLLERKRDYYHALRLLKQLLDSPYHRGRRGKWWNRMGKDMGHLGHKVAAEHVSHLGLKDELVTGGEYYLVVRLKPTIALHHLHDNWGNLSCFGRSSGRA